MGFCADMKASVLRHMWNFFLDLREWTWVPEENTKLRYLRLPFVHLMWFGWHLWCVFVVVCLLWAGVDVDMFSTANPAFNTGVAHCQFGNGCAEYFSQCEWVPACMKCLTWTSVFLQYIYKMFILLLLSIYNHERIIKPKLNFVEPVQLTLQHLVSFYFAQYPKTSWVSEISVHLMTTFSRWHQLNYIFQATLISFFFSSKKGCDSSNWYQGNLYNTMCKAMAPQRRVKGSGTPCFQSHITRAMRSRFQHHLLLELEHILPMWIFEPETDPWYVVA